MLFYLGWNDVMNPSLQVHHYRLRADTTITKPLFTTKANNEDREVNSYRFVIDHNITLILHHQYKLSDTFIQ